MILSITINSDGFNNKDDNKEYCVYFMTRIRSVEERLFIDL